MIEILARQLSTTKNSIVRDATMLGGARMVLPAGLLACATALGLFVEAGSHSAQAYYREGGGEASSTGTAVRLAPAPPSLLSRIIVGVAGRRRRRPQLSSIR